MQLKQILIACAMLSAVGACTNGPTTTGNFRHQGYLLDAAGNNAVVKATGYDVCVRTSDWTPARAIIECDPDLVPKPVVKAPVAPPAPKVQAPPPPAPKVAAPPPTPPVQRFTLSTDTLFDFDKTVLKPEGRKKLDELADTLRGTRYESIVATGHTDRAGSVAYNLSLSQRRADAVKDYLLGKGLDVGRITAIGKGKSETTVKPTDCRTPGMTRAAILACLQPDRRVVIEATGTKEAGAKPEAAPAPVAPKAIPPAKAGVKPRA